MSNIDTHFEMLMDEAEQERIGCTKTRDASMRVMRLLSAYSDLRAALTAARADADALRKAASEYLDWAHGYRTADTLTENRKLGESLNINLRQALAARVRPAGTEGK